MRTIHSYMEAAGYRPSGFDYMRLILATMVLVSHGLNTALAADGMREVWKTPLLGGLFSMVLPMFFTLSGFLVAGSMDRTRTVAKFLGLRAIRIYPALVVDILFTALIIGPFVTSLSWDAYFSDPEFAAYLWNVTGHDIVFTLPGAFDNNPQFYANLQLWTVPFELMCYIALGAMMAAAYFVRGSIVIPLGTFVIFALVMARTGLTTNWQFTDWYGPVSGPMLIVAFLLGVNIHLFRDRIPCSPMMILGLILATLIGFSFGPYDRLIGVFPAALLTVCLGVLNPRRINIIKHADLSYGLFLYHYILQQALISAAGGELAWYILIPVSFILTLAFAYASWTLIEKPALELRKPLGRLEDRWIALWEKNKRDAPATT
jgi:peptidoglycan/LPS O-acetylase OafA/YrhL